MKSHYDHDIRPLVATAHAAASVGCPLAHRTHLTLLAHCVRYSSWSIIHSYLFL